MDFSFIKMKNNHIKIDLIELGLGLTRLLKKG